MGQTTEFQQVPPMKIESDVPVQMANAALAGRVRHLEEHNSSLLTRLSTQAATINRLLEEKRELEEKTKTTIVVDKHPQMAIERHRATIAQMGERIHEQNVELRAARGEIAQLDDTNRGLRQTVQTLQEAVVELSGETNGLRNQEQRLRQLCEARLHHIHSLETALENNGSLLATVNLEKLEAAVLDLDEVFGQIGDLLHAELTERTRVA